MGESTKKSKKSIYAFLQPQTYKYESERFLYD